MYIYIYVYAYMYMHMWIEFLLFIYLYLHGNFGRCKWGECDLSNSVTLRVPCYSIGESGEKPWGTTIFGLFHSPSDQVSLQVKHVSSSKPVSWMWRKFDSKTCCSCPQRLPEATANDEPDSSSWAARWHCEMPAVKIHSGRGWRLIWR